VVARVQNRYDQAKIFQARFTQKSVGRLMGAVTVSTGQVHFRNRGRYAAGTTTSPRSPHVPVQWAGALAVNEPEEKQAFKQAISKNSAVGRSLASSWPRAGSAMSR